VFAGFAPERADVTLRNRIRVGALVAFLLVVTGLKAADWSSAQPPEVRQGIRLASANANAEALSVAMTLQPYSPDVIALQETGSSCERAARELGMLFLDGADQCILAGWPMTPVPVEWPGPWQPPQIVLVESEPPLLVANLRFAMPEVLAALATLGNQWYSESERQAQFPALRRLLPSELPTIACGDFNAFPSEVDLGSGLADAWRGGSLGATFPGWLPVVRIDQCWNSADLFVRAAWTTSIPSDHRAVVVDFTLPVASSATLEPPASGQLGDR